MSKLAFLFPGQGSQAAGMGRDLAENFPAAREIFDRADAALGFPISKLCFDGPDADLKLTENTQPAILTCSIAAYAVLRERGIKPDYVVGHSLGEYSALVAAGAIDFADAVRLVRKRGRYMQEAVAAGVGAMAAILGMDPARVGPICEQAAQGEVVSPANFNSPAQVVIAGHAAAVARAMELAKAAGALRTVLLPVSAPFHCALMKPAQERLSPDLDACAFHDLAIPLVNNVAAKEIGTASEAREGLRQQVPSPVRWEETIRHLIAQGVEHFVEAGPGKVLIGLVRSIDRSLRISNVENAATVEKLEP